MAKFTPWCKRCSCVVEPADTSHARHGEEIVLVPDIYALSLWEPWLGAIFFHDAARAKPIENRPWAPYPWVRAHRWIAMHSAQTLDDEEARIIIGQRLGEMPPSYQTEEMRGRRGKIHGLVRIDGYVEPGRYSQIPPAIDAAFRRWWVPDQFGWTIGARVLLREPVAAPGRQKVWRVPVQAALKVADQIPWAVVEQLAQPTQDAR